MQHYAQLLVWSQLCLDASYLARSMYKLEMNGHGIPTDRQTEKEGPCEASDLFCLRPCERTPFPVPNENTLSKRGLLLSTFNFDTLYTASNQISM